MGVRRQPTACEAHVERLGILAYPLDIEHGTPLPPAPDRRD
jgi:hypothetical protein